MIELRDGRSKPQKRSNLHTRDRSYLDFPPYDGYVEFNDNNGNSTWSFYSYEIDDWCGRIIKVKPDSEEVEYLSWFN